MTILEALSYLKKAKYNSTQDLDVFRSKNYNTDYLQVRFAADDSWSKYTILAGYDPMSGVDWYTIFTIDKDVSYIRYEIISNKNEVLCSCQFNYPMTEESFFQDSLVNDYETLTFKDALELPKYFTAKRITPRDQY